MHIPFSAWVIVAAIVLGVLALQLYGPLRRYLPRLGGSVIAGALAATAVTAWADRHRHAALAAAASHPAAHKVSVGGSLVAAFVVITLTVAAIVFILATLAAGRARRPRSRSVRAW